MNSERRPLGRRPRRHPLPVGIMVLTLAAGLIGSATATASTTAIATTAATATPTPSGPGIVPPPAATSIAAAAQQDGKLLLFATGTDRSVHFTMQNSAGSGDLAAWTGIDGSMVTLAAATGADGRVELFALDALGHIWHRKQDALNSPYWTNWASLSGTLASIALARNANGRLELFGATGSGQVWFIAESAAGADDWPSWTQISDNTLTQVAAATDSAGLIELFGVDGGGNIYRRVQSAPDSGDWTDRVLIPGLLSTISVTDGGPAGQMEILGANSAGTVWTRTQTGAAGDNTWADWAQLDGLMTRIAAVNDQDGRVEIFGANSAGQLFHRSQTAAGAATWTAWQTIEPLDDTPNGGYYPPSSYGPNDQFVGYTPWDTGTNSNTYGYTRATSSERLWTFSSFSPADHSKAPYSNTDDNSAQWSALGDSGGVPPVYSDPSFTSTSVGYNTLLARDTDEGTTNDLENALRTWWLTLSPNDQTRFGETSLRSNNNVTAIQYGGRYYVAVRTSPLHFANDLPGFEYRVDDQDTTSCAPDVTTNLSQCEVTHLIVVSAPASINGINGINVDDWRVETNVWLNRDIREPNFLILNDAAGNPQSLRLYFIENGRTLTTFQTGYTYYIEKPGTEAWSAPVKLNSAGDGTYVSWGTGYIPWRVKTVTSPAHNGGKPMMYMLRYKGAHYQYNNPDGTPNTSADMQVQFLASYNGNDWFPVRDLYSADRSGTAEQRSVVYTGGGSEADFAFDSAGNLYSTIRIEDYDVRPGGTPGQVEPGASNDRSLGSRLCAAPASNIAAWTCVQSPFRYDSPLLFSRGDHIYMIARRNLYPEDSQAGYGDFKDYVTDYSPSFPFETGHKSTDALWDSYSNYAPFGFGTLLDLFNGDPSTWSETEAAAITYWIMPKRTSLYEIDTAKLWNFINTGNLHPCDYGTFIQRNGDTSGGRAIVQVMPSATYACEQQLPAKVITDFVGTNGDTSYPALIQETRDQYLFLNYTSQFWDYTEKSWISGQISPTFVLATTLHFQNGVYDDADRVDIPGNGPAVTSPITVSRVPGNAPSTLKVSVNIKHTYRGDLVIDLVAPDGTAYRLKNGGDGSAANVITTYTVDASAKAANGTWRLRVQDVGALGMGYVDDWKLAF